MRRVYFTADLTFRRSHTLIVLIAAIHLIAAIAFVRSSLPIAICLIVVTGLAISAWSALSGALQQGTRQGLLRLGEQGKIAWPTKQDDISCPVGQVVPQQCVNFGWAIWLGWRFRDRLLPSLRRQRFSMLLRDQFTPEDWRLLNIWLRHCALPSPESEV